VVSALGDLDAFVSAQQLHQCLVAEGSPVGLTTVYRTLQALAEAGEADTIVQPDGEVLYRRCSGEHHHHLVCTSCGVTVEVQDDDLEGWAHRIARRHGFRDVTHSLELRGVCATCAARAANSG
jgi:Fur family ferric uptake transcriptional regulator